MISTSIKYPYLHTTKIGMIDLKQHSLKIKLTLDSKIVSQKGSVPVPLLCRTRSKMHALYELDDHD